MESGRIGCHTLNMCLGEEVLKTVETLLFACTDDKKDLSATLQLLEQHYAGEANVTLVWFHFFQRNEREGESFAEYLSTLHRLSATCKFDALQEELIRDRIVNGLRDEAIQLSLLQLKNLTLANCNEACCAAKTTA